LPRGGLRARIGWHGRARPRRPADAPPHRLTLAEREARVGARAGSTAETLRAILAEEITRGHVDYEAVSGCCFLAAGIEPELREALRSLRLPDDDDSRRRGPHRDTDQISSAEREW
jgi:hypothetical protein